MTKSNAFPLRRYSLSAWPFGTADGPLAVLYAEDRSSMIDLAHLSWALSDLLLAPAKDWSRLRAAMWEGCRSRPPRPSLSPTGCEPMP